MLDVECRDVVGGRCAMYDYRETRNVSEQYRYDFTESQWKEMCDVGHIFHMQHDKYTTMNFIFSEGYLYCRGRV